MTDRLGWAPRGLRMVALALALALGAVAGCDADDDGGGGADAGPGVADASPDAFESICGEPGDEGNALGVGKFCLTISDCSSTAEAPLCSSLGDPASRSATTTAAPSARSTSSSHSVSSSRPCREGPSS